MSANTNRFVPLLVALVVGAFAFSLAFLFFLPAVFTAGLPTIEDELVAYAKTGGTQAFKVLRASYQFDLYHPIHQSFTHDFAAPIATESGLQLIVEEYPKGKLGLSEQLIRGTAAGTIELSLVPSEAFGEAIDEGTVERDSGRAGYAPLGRYVKKSEYNRIKIAAVGVLAVVKGPRRSLWRTASASAGAANKVAVFNGAASAVRRAGASVLSPVAIDRGSLFLAAREGRFGYAELDAADLQCLDSPSSEAFSEVPGTAVRPNYLLLINKAVYDALPAQHARILERNAARFIEETRELLSAEN